MHHAFVQIMSFLQFGNKHKKKVPFFFVFVSQIYFSVSHTKKHMRHHHLNMVLNQTLASIQHDCHFDDFDDISFGAVSYLELEWTSLRVSLGMIYIMYNGEVIIKKKKKLCHLSQYQ